MELKIKLHADDVAPWLQMTRFLGNLDKEQWVGCTLEIPCSLAECLDERADWPARVLVYWGMIDVRINPDLADYCCSLIQKDK